ncbi:hypothetical protein KY343_05480 [Candidatus Woesearchaeota archaeon]|nr:hypothetical protein [Candidatus Woesearchaeota archaeon]
MSKLVLPHENLVFKGDVENIYGLQAYSRLIEEYVLGGKIGSRIYTKEDDILLMFEKDPIKSLNLIYAAGKDLGEQDVWSRVQKMLDTGKAEIEAYQELPEKDLEKAVLKNFDYQGAVLDSCRQFDEKVAKGKIVLKTEAKPKQGNIRPKRKFLGYARTVDQVTGYLSLAQYGFGGPNYSRLGLLFSCEGKLPLYLILKKLGGSEKAGFFLKFAYFFDKVIELSERALEDPGEYVFGRLKARFRRDTERPTRIECFDNPLEYGKTTLEFGNPISILAFKNSLERKLLRDTRTDLEHDDADSTEPEDKDTRAMPTATEHKPLGDEFENEAETRLDELFGGDEEKEDE